ncbi:hypothetical protein GGS21DRAFT_546455 [Xylaria nigripes]|nr:hypothetical protein GGS21DRAFT_546455 [Xylaria nigripes]
MRTTNNYQLTYSDTYILSLLAGLAGAESKAELLRNANDALVQRNVQKQFPLFPRLPTEIRRMIWSAAMENEDPRLVHMRALRCGIVGRERRGCPRGKELGRTITIDGNRYDQAPSYFFVNHEARFMALEYYNIRFPVIQEASTEFEGPIARIVNHVVMSPNDILVSWYPEVPAFIESLEFGPQAALVRNILVSPWAHFQMNNCYRLNTQMLMLALQLVDQLGNVDSLEKIFMHVEDLKPPIRYLGCSRRYDDGGFFSRREVWTQLTPEEQPIFNRLTPEKLFFLIAETVK